MRKDKKSKILIISVLTICVIFLGIGFSALSSTLSISSRANIKPNEDTFSVKFSTSPDSIISGTINPDTGPQYGAPATLNETTVSGLSAKFTAPGQKVGYRFYVINDGEFDAYINNIIYGEKKCTPEEGTSNESVQAACAGDGIVLTLFYAYDPPAGSGASYIWTETTKTNINNNKINIGQSISIIMYIEYRASAPRADGDFSIKFGDITFDYSTVD